MTNRIHTLAQMGFFVMASACFSLAAWADVEGPRGLFALGSAMDRANTPEDERLSNLRDYDFLQGYTLRLQWQDVDLGNGQYDFAVIDEALAAVQNNQYATELNLELLILSPPEHVADNAAETWEHFKAGDIPVPWDTSTQQAYANLIHALANHTVFDASVGQQVALSQHAALTSLNASIPGISSIRDNVGSSGLTRLVELPSYDRQLFINAVTDALTVNRNAFEDKFGFVGFFSMTDQEDANFNGQTLNEAVIDIIQTHFSGENGQPSLGLFQELLSDVGPNPNNILGENLLAAADDTYIMFQALASWLQPHTGAESLTSNNPATGISLGYNTYGATFFELYIQDIDGAFNGAVDAQGNPLIDDLRFWNTLLTTIPEPASAILWLSAGAAMLIPRPRGRRASNPAC